MIAIFIPSFRGGGAERAMLVFAEAVQSLGHPVHLIVASSDGPLSKLVPKKVILHDLQATRMLKALPKLTRLLRQLKPQKLYATIVHTNVIAILANLMAGSPAKVIIRESNSPLSENKSSLSRKAIHLIVPYAYPLAYSIIAVSDGVAAELARISPKMAGKISVLPTPVVTPSMLLAANEPCQHPWLAAGQMPVVLAAGRLHFQKDFQTLIRAFAEVRLRTPCRLIILGEGSMRAELEELLVSLGLEENVSLAGFELNPFPYLKRSAVFVLSSRYEGMPNILIQAMALGTKVVSTDCKSGPRECLQNGELGELVPVGDVEAMANAIVKALTKDTSTHQQRTAQIIQDEYGMLAAARRYLAAGD